MKPATDTCGCGSGPCRSDNVETLARCISLRLARDLGEEQALRLIPAVVRALTGAVAESAERRLRQEIVAAGRRLSDLGFVSGKSGNISVRDTPTSMLITAAGLRKGEMTPDDMCRVDLAGNQVGSGPCPSSEFRIHVMAYRKRPDVQAIVHSHPPFATGFATAGVALEGPVLAEALHILGPSVPLVSYGTPSTWELAERLEPWLPGHDAFLLANHGVLCLGTTLSEAVHRNETLEFLARVVLTARILGGERLLSQTDLEKLALVGARKG